MANEQITNAQTAAAAPANGAPDAREGRRQEIMKSEDYWREGPTTQALRLEMARLLADPAVVAQQDQAAAKVSPDERRRRELSRDPKYLAGDPALVAEMKRVLARLESPEEKQAIDGAPLEEQRSRFGLSVPDERVLPKAYQEEYERDFSGHEQDFLVAARQHGLDSKLVVELRDAGIRMAIEAEGRAVSDEAWAAVQKRFAGRLSQKQFESLKSWWRTSVEGMS
jgi:hypothetical protein